jgi:hypothetical protein
MIRGSDRFRLHSHSIQLTPAEPVFHSATSSTGVERRSSCHACVPCFSVRRPGRPDLE